MSGKVAKKKDRTRRGLKNVIAPPNMDQLVFVYGTLKEGFPNFKTNTGRRLPGEFVTCEKFSLYINGDRHSACLTQETGKGHCVRGQVFAVDDVGLAKMDELERILLPDGYKRRLIDVNDLTSLDASPTKVWVYLKDSSLVRDIKSGPHPEYTPEHAALYRPRERPLQP